MDFVNRKEDLKLLLSLWAKKEAQLVVCYGRRRVGKTALLDYFAQKKELLHWMAYRSTSHDLLADFSFHLYCYLNRGEKPGKGFTYGSWQVAFDTLALASQNKRFGVIIDEFPYLVEADPSVSSILQASWDKKLKNSSCFLGISGSRMGMIHNEVLSSKAPLYGRATAVIHLQPIELACLNEFYPQWSLTQLVKLYGITGGIPKYFEFIDPSKSLYQSLCQAIEDRTSFLTAEPQFLLHEEFREIKIYIAILRALGHKALELKNVSSFCGIPTKSLSKYMDQFLQINLIERRVSVDAKEDSRKSLYQIKDPFLRFYFYFIDPFKQDIENKRFERVKNYLNKNFDAYMGRFVFEDICKNWLKDQSDKNKLNFHLERVGSYWDKEMQIDIVGLNAKEKMLLVGECKWTDKKLGMDVLTQLEDKAKKIAQNKDYHVQLFFFSKSGYTTSTKNYAQKRHYQLVSLEKIYSDENAS